MDTTDFEDVLREACGEAGTDADNLAQPEFMAWRRFANRRLDVAWRYHYWPELGRCEQRFYRLPYDPSRAYAAAIAGLDNSANEVWWPLTGQYFVALTTVPVAVTLTLENDSRDPIVWNATTSAGVTTQYPQAATGPVIQLSGVYTGLYFTVTGTGDIGAPVTGNNIWDGDTLENTPISPLGTPPTDAGGNINLNFWAATSQYAIQPCVTGTSYDCVAYQVAAQNQPPFNLTATYTQGQRVWYMGNIYQLFALTATGILPTDPTSWGLIPPFDAYVPFEQTGFTPFTVVEGVFSANPRTTTRGNTLNYFLSERGVQVMTAIPYAWIQFRLRCPKLNGDMFRSDTAYPAGAGMYFINTATPGNFYTARVTTSAGDTPETAPAKWCVVKLPRIFHRYLVLGMAADWEKDLTGANLGARSAAVTADQIAQAELDDVKSLYVGQMGQRVKTEVQTR